MNLYLLDWEAKRKMNISFYQWEEKEEKESVVKASAKPVIDVPLLFQVRPDMTEAELAKLVQSQFPDAKPSPGDWSGQTGYVDFRLNSQYTLSVSEYNDPKDFNLRFVHADTIVYLLDQEAKRRMNISFYKWEEKVPGAASPPGPESSAASPAIPSPAAGSDATRDEEKARAAEEEARKRAAFAQSSAAAGSGKAPAQASGSPPRPPRPAYVPTNSQESLQKIVGEGFDEAKWGTTWQRPTDLLPDNLPGCEQVSGPKDVRGQEVSRASVIYKLKSADVTLRINCYRRNSSQPDAVAPGQLALVSMPEPDYKYEAVEFHQLKAATAAYEDQRALVFRDGDLLFKFEAAGGDAAAREKAVRAAAEATWSFRQDARAKRAAE
jgi:hypothetical protein